MKNKHKKTLKLIFSHPGNIKWRDIEALLIALGAELIEQESSRIEVFLFGEVRYFIAHIQVLILIKGQ